MTELKRDKTSFTGVLGSENMDKLRAIKELESSGGGAIMG